MKLTTKQKQLVKEYIQKILKESKKSLHEDDIADIKAKAKEYPGSYSLGISGRKKINNSVVTYLTYTNPNNITDAAYLVYVYDQQTYSLTIKTSIMYNKKQIEMVIENDM